MTNTITGTAGNDTLTGTSGDDAIYGLDGNDTLVGSAGNDQLYGGDGNDVLEGDEGNDLLDGGAGIDTANYANSSGAITVNLLTGTATGTDIGTDTLVGIENARGGSGTCLLIGDDGDNTLSGGYSSSVLRGGAGNDTLTGSAGADTLEGGAGNDTLDGGSGIDTVTYADATSGVTVSLAVSSAQAVGGGLGTDTLNNIENLAGSAFNDTLTGGFGDNVLAGGAGDDLLDGSGGTDIASYADATSGVTVSLSVATAQAVGGGLGSDTLVNMEGLAGSTYNDSLTGNSGANTFDISGGGNDTVNGLDGDDGIVAGSALTASDRIDGGAGTDYLYLLGDYSGGVVFNASTISNIEYIFLQRSLTMAETYAYNLKLTEGNVASGGSLQIQLGDSKGSTIDGSAVTSGRLILIGGSGTDLLIGGAGDDSIGDSSNGNDTLIGGAGNDHLSVSRDSFGGGASTVLLDGGDGNDALGISARMPDNPVVATMLGGSGNDSFTVISGGTITIDAGTGDDSVIVNSATSLTVTLGAGSDTVTMLGSLSGVLTSADAGKNIDITDFVTGNSGDRFDFGEWLNYLPYPPAGWDRNSNPFASGYLQLVQNGTATDLQVDLDGLGTGYGWATLVHFENTQKANFTTFNFAGLPPDGSQVPGSTITGTDASDDLDGTLGADMIYGLGAQDFIGGAGGNDTIHGGDGSDYIYGGPGSDTLYGDAGDDYLIGDDTVTFPHAYNDTLDGGAGNDTAVFTGNRADHTVTANADGSYTITGPDGTDTLINIEMLSFSDQSISPANAAAAAPNSNTIAGTNGADTLTGTSSNDTITGGSGNDILNGGAGNDMLSGGDDEDRLTGGAGDDALDGGPSVDTAVVSGNRSAYTITQTSTGKFTVTGPDGTDTLTNIEYLKFDDQTMRLLPGNGTTVNFANPPSTFMAAIRDFDGNDLGGAASWKLIGTADVNGDGRAEQILFNREIGRWAEVGTEADGKTYFANSGWAGDTRVVGIYIDPLVANGTVVKGSDTDSQRRFQNDLMIDNIKTVLGQADYNHDGLQEVYFSLTDGTAYLHAYMHADGNIQYANYQNKQQVIDYLTTNGVSSSTWSTWFPASQAAPESVLDMTTSSSAASMLAMGG